MMASCGEETNGQARAIETTITGYVTTHNEGDFAQCLSYFTDYEDEDDALAFMSFMRSLSGPHSVVR